MAEMLTNDGLIFNSGINAVQAQTAGPSSTTYEPIDVKAGGWLMAAAAYYGLVTDSYTDAGSNAQSTANTMSQITLTPENPLRLRK